MAGDEGGWRQGQEGRRHGRADQRQAKAEAKAAGVRRAAEVTAKESPGLTGVFFTSVSARSVRAENL